MARYWIFTTDRETIGPFGMEELREKAVEGVLQPNTQVCLEGSESWLAAGEIPEIANAIAFQATPRFAPPTAGEHQGQFNNPATTRIPENQIPTLTFMEGFKRSMKNYGRFRGRSRRSELWWAGLAVLILMFPVMIMFVLAIFAASRISGDVAVITAVVLYLVLIGAWGVPWGMSLCVRRLHDIGKSGWWYVLLTVLSFLPFVGIIGTVILIVWYCTDSEPGENRWGPNPKIAVDSPPEISTST